MKQRLIEIDTKQFNLDLLTDSHEDSGIYECEFVKNMLKDGWKITKFKVISTVRYLILFEKE